MAGDGESREMGPIGRCRILIPLRRPVLPVAGEIGGVGAIQDMPPPPEALPECKDEEPGGDISKVNRSKRPKLPLVANRS